MEQLTKRYGSFTALNGITFSVAEGEFFGFLGPNGAGKTTTINILTGLARPTSGTAWIAGYDCFRERKKVKELLGVVPDESNLYEDLNGFENLCFCGALYGMERQTRERRAKELLSTFGLEEVALKPFGAYSKGMKRKLTIAACLMHDPPILFLDEPTTGIDVASARQIRELIKNLNRQGKTVFLTTHYIEEAERLCDRLAFIVEGRIVTIGSLEELLHDFRRERILEFSFAEGIGEIRVPLEEAFPEIAVEVKGNKALRVHSKKPLNLVPFINFFDDRKLTVYEAKLILPSLEEVFVKITGVELEKMKQEKEGKKS